MLPERWAVGLRSTYGPVDLGSGYKNSWTFRYMNEEPIIIESERAWDGGEAWLPDEVEKFARLFAAELGWSLDC